MQDLNDIYYFVQIVAHGGFAAAARSIGVQKSTLSRRLSLLEERLGVALIYRSSRQFAVTEIGSEFYRQCLIVLEEVETAETVVDKIQGEPHGSIKMACPVGLLSDHFSELVPLFMQKYPKVEIHLKCLNRRIDVIGDGYDLAIYEGTTSLEHSALVSRKLGTNLQCLVASPGLLEGRKLPLRAEDLADLPSVAYAVMQPDKTVGSSPRKYEWLLESESEKRTIQHSPRLVTDSVATLRAAVLRGLGVGQLPQSAINQDLEAGRLISLFPLMPSSVGDIYAIFPSRKGLSPGVRALVNFFAETLTARNAPL